MHRFSLPVYEPHPLFTQFTQGKLSRIHPDGGELWYHDFIAQQKEPHERTQHKPPCSNAQQSHHAAPPDRRTPHTSPTGQPCIRLFGGRLHATFPQQHLPFRSARIGTNQHAHADSRAADSSHHNEASNAPTNGTFPATEPPRLLVEQVARLSTNSIPTRRLHLAKEPAPTFAMDTRKNAVTCLFSLVEQQPSLSLFFS